MNDDWKNFTPRANAPIVAQPNQSAAAPVDINDPDALRTLAKGKLVAILQTAPVNVSLVAAIRELLDRIDGKPIQTQVTEHKGTVATINYTATDRFFEEIGLTIEH
jgi:hypothetical protein